MDRKWKQITGIKEIGDKTDMVETVEFPEYISSNCNLTACRYNSDELKDKLLTEIMEKYYTEFGLNEENRYIFIDVVEKYGDMTYRHLCENYCFAFEKE